MTARVLLRKAGHHHAEHAEKAPGLGVQIDCLATNILIISDQNNLIIADMTTYNLSVLAYRTIIGGPKTLDLQPVLNHLLKGSIRHCTIRHQKVMA